MVGLSRLKPRLTLTLLLAGAVTLNLTAALAAQQADPDKPVERDPAVQPQATPSTTQDSENNPVIKSPEEAKSTPFEYQPSEEISEDLSVSFPVDI